MVVELDGKLAEYVRGWFDLPKAPLLRLRVGEAREVTETLTAGHPRLHHPGRLRRRSDPAAADHRRVQPARRRVLAPGGMYVVNSGDAPDLKNAREDAATIAATFAHTAIIADPAMLKGRRYGNMVMAGSDVPFGDDPGWSGGCWAAPYPPTSGTTRRCGPSRPAPRSADPPHPRPDLASSAREPGGRGPTPPAP